MIALTSTLSAAQKAGGQTLYKVTFTKTGETTRVYGSDTTNRIPTGFPLKHYRDDWLQTAELTVENRDGNLTALDLIGYQALIEYGYQTSAGDEYQGSDVLKCISQGFVSGYGEQLVIFGLAGRGNQMAEDRASSAYEPDSANKDTVKTIVTAIVTATMPPFNHCEVLTLTWELTAYQEDELANVFKPADFLRVHKDQSRLEVLKDVLSNTGLDGRFEGDGALHIFQTFARPWTAATGIDLNEIAKPSVPSDWAANTAYSVNDRRKPTTQNGYYYVCSTAGTSGGTEPSWARKDGDTVSDDGVIWTCRDTNYVYTCTTTGTTGGTEPVWTYAKNDTMSDSGVVWTLQYDYDYDDVASGHNFWRKGVTRRLVIPNKITVRSVPGAKTIYSGNATDARSNALLPIEEVTYRTLVSNAEAADIALAKIDRAARDAETGSGFSMLNIGQEIHDYILITDSWEGDACRGRIRSLTRYAGPGVFKMTFSFGIRLAKSEMGSLRSLRLAEIEPVPPWAWEMLDYIDAVVELHKKDISDLYSIIKQMQIGVPDWHVSRNLRIPVI